MSRKANDPELTERQTDYVSFLLGERKLSKPPAQKELEDALLAAWQIKEAEKRIFVITEFTEHLSQDDIDKILAEVTATPSLFKFLSRFAFRLTLAQLGLVEDAAKTLLSGYDRDWALEAIAPYISPDKLRDLLLQIDESVLAYSLEKLAQSSIGERLLVLFEAIYSIEDGYTRRITYERIAPYLSANVPAEDLAESIQKIDDDLERGKVIALVAPHLHCKHLIKIFGVAWNIENYEAKALAVRALGPDAEQVAEALVDIEGMDDGRDRTMALVGLAPWLEPRQLTQALDAAVGMDDTFTKASALGCLAPYLTGDQVSVALVAVKEIPDELSRAAALRGFGPYLLPVHSNAALAITKTIRDKQLMASCIKSLTPIISSTRRPALMTGAFTEAKAILADLVPPEDEWSETGPLTGDARARPRLVVNDKALSAINEKPVAAKYPELGSVNTVGLQEKQTIRASAALIDFGERRVLANARKVYMSLLPNELERETNNVRNFSAIFSRRRYTDEVATVERRKEGDVENERERIDQRKALEGLKLFLDGLGLTEERIDEGVLAGVALAAAKAIVKGRPKWVDRKAHRELSHLTVPRFVREVYRDLIECKLLLPDGRLVWHLRLPEGQPVWQEAVRHNDRKVVQILQGYINKQDAGDLGDAEGLIFENKINRAQSKRPKRQMRKAGGHKLAR